MSSKITNSEAPGTSAKGFSAKTILVTYLLASASVLVLTLHVYATRMDNIHFVTARLLFLPFLGPISFLGIVPIPFSSASVPLVVAYLICTLLFFVPFYICRKLGLTPSFGGNVFFGMLWLGIGALGLLADVSQ